MAKLPIKTLVVTGMKDGVQGNLLVTTDEEKAMNFMIGNGYVMEVWVNDDKFGDYIYDERWFKFSRIE